MEKKYCVDSTIIKKIWVPDLYFLEEKDRSQINYIFIRMVIEMK